MDRKKAFRWLRIALLLYAALGIAVYYFQDYFFFRPQPLDSGYRYDFGQPYREVNLAFDHLSNINIIQFTTDSTPKGCVLYFHGNRKNVGWYAKHAPLFTRAGYEVWMIDYPGFGKSTGRLHEEVLHAYALQLYRLARKSFAADSIILYGRSMGTGIAARLASREQARQLILETPYYSFTSVAAHFLPIYPVERMIHVKLPTYQFIPQVDEPILILHGTDDGLIPLSNARRLQVLLKPGDRFVTIEGGSHNDLAAFEEFRKAIANALGSRQPAVENRK
jgi:pimeloyl-ACP methyl ester carboxylesterase